MQCPEHGEHTQWSWDNKCLKMITIETMIDSSIFGSIKMEMPLGTCGKIPMEEE